MYSVSEEYKKAMKRPVQRHFLKGAIGENDFTEENILAGSFSITNQCSGNENVQIGQVYVGELSATFLNIPLERYQWKGATITPFFGMELEDGTREFIPLGVYTVDTAEWTSSGVVVKAYDHMALLDEPCNKTMTEVTPYTLVKKIEEETGVLFANTEEDFEHFPNGTHLISETTTNDVETWRDLVAWLAQTICAFATADREGKIVFRMYTDEVSDTIDDRHRFTGASFSDFVTRYTGISVVNMADSMMNYYGIEPDDGLTMNLGSNPFLQYGLDSTKEEMRNAILEGIQKINYVPFKVKAIGNPAYDLGDILVFSNGLADGTKKYCITKYVFNFHGTYEMTGVGQDPALSNARSKTDKNIIGLVSNTDENKLVHYQFSNTKVIELPDGKRETIASIRFATATKDSEVSLWAELLLETKNPVKHLVGDTKIEAVKVSNPPTVEELQKEIQASDATIVDLNSRLQTAETSIKKPDRMTATVSYMLNGQELSYHPVETYFIDGQHLLSLHYYIGNVKANTIYNFVIMLEMNGGSGHFDTECVNVLLTGMGLAGTGQWDGTITTEEKFAAISFKDIAGEIRDQAEVSKLTPKPVSAFTDVFAFSFASILGGFQDAPLASIVVRYYILSDTEGSPSMNEQYVITNSEDAFILETNYETTSKKVSIDEGYLQVLDIFTDYDELLTLERMVVK